MKQVVFDETTTSLGLTKLASISVRESAATPAAASFDVLEKTAGTLALPVELAANGTYSEVFSDGNSLGAIASDTEADSLVIANATGEFDGVAVGF